jgi:hypothetical protein
VGTGRWSMVGIGSGALVVVSLVFLPPDVRGWGLVAALTFVTCAAVVSHFLNAGVRNTAAGTMSGSFAQFRDNLGSITLRQDPEFLVRLPGETTVFTGRRTELTHTQPVGTWPVISTGSAGSWPAWKTARANNSDPRFLLWTNIRVRN